MSKILTVSQLNQYIKGVLESESFLMNLTLVGEVISLTKHYTGHFYFTLKDENSSIKCMMFSSYASRLNFNLNNGQQVLIQGYIGVYDKNGTYQVYCRNIIPYGEGQYLLELAKLKEKLKNEGLFDKEKKNIPFIPKKIGLITAKTGAAIHDFFSTINKRLKVETYIFPCLVQGEFAPQSIIEQIDIAEQFDLDVIVITRGGGSKEDLRCFNDEMLVRRAADIKISLITAVGHQIDTTLIDYVSDLVCITPTDAAQHVVPSKQELLNNISNLNGKIERLKDRLFEKNSEKLLNLTRTLEAYSPTNKLKNLSKDILNYQFRLNVCINNQLKLKENAINLLNLKIKNNEVSYLNDIYKKIVLLNDKLNYLNPYSILDNGYSLIKNKDNEVVSSIKQLKPDDKVYLNLSDGVIEARIIEIKEK